MGVTFPHPLWSISSYQQTAAEVTFGLVALISLAYCIAVARRERKLWPLFVFGGAALTITYEPFNNLLGHCAYPLLGQHTAIDFVGQKIPLYILFVYAFYFSVPVVWLMQRFEAGITMRQLAKYFAVALVLCAAFEPFFITQDWWKYTGQQPLSFTGLPMWWWFVNPMSVFAVAGLLHLLKRHVLTDDRQTALLVVFGPLSVFAFHGSAAVPLYIGINAHSMTDAVIGTFGSIAIAITYMWIVARAVTVPALAAQPACVRAATDRRISGAEHVFRVVPTLVRIQK
jgi:hypothetical protein